MCQIIIFLYQGDSVNNLFNILDLVVTTTTSIILCLLKMFNLRRNRLYSQHCFLHRRFSGFNMEMCCGRCVSMAK